MTAVAAPSIRELLVEAVGKGARTVNAIIEQSRLTKKQVMDNLCHLKNDGTVVTTTDGSLTLRAGHKMPVKVFTPEPGEPMDFAPAPSGRQMANRQIDVAADSLAARIEPPSIESAPSAFEDYIETAGMLGALPAACGRIAKELAPSPQPARAIEPTAELPESQPDAPRAPTAEPAPPVADPAPAFVAIFGEYVVIRRRELEELIRAAKVITRWEKTCIHFEVPEMAIDLADEFDK